MPVTRPAADEGADYRGLTIGHRLETAVMGPAPVAAFSLDQQRPSCLLGGVSEAARHKPPVLGLSCGGSGNFR